MEFIGQLWLPILVATAFCFIASAVLWMMGPHHKADWKGLSNQDAVIAALRQGNPSAGAYMFPFADRKDKTAFEASMKLWAEGPAGILYVYPRGRLGMGGMMAKQLIFFLVVNALIALLASRTIATPMPYLRVFKIIVTVAFMTYALGTVPESIWFGRPWRHWLSNALDAAIYAGLTAGTFGWLWGH